MPRPTFGTTIPPCCGMRADFTPFSLETQAGRPAILLIANATNPTHLAPTLRTLTEIQPQIAKRGADLIILADEDLIRALPPGPTLVDCGPAYPTLCGVPPGTALIFVIDRALRIATPPLPTNHPTILETCLATLLALPRETPTPALILPNVLDAALCTHLIHRFETSISIAGAITGIDEHGRPTTRIAPHKKHRRDLLIPPNDPLHAQLRATLLARCAQPIARAFAARVTQTDRLLIARYDAPNNGEPAGWFARHRDTNAANIAFREFAISVNLNADFAGGHLTFPEFTDQPHAPPAGGALIFSAALLHEATRVTRGQRYVLLTFLHGDAAEARRRAYQAAHTASSTTPAPAIA